MLLTVSPQRPPPPTISGPMPVEAVTRTCPSARNTHLPSPACTGLWVLEGLPPTLRGTSWAVSAGIEDRPTSPSLAGQLASSWPDPRPFKMYAYHFRGVPGRLSVYHK
ncbi:hypothetical protein PYCCODRAFT_466716 [Trametes coccinea BRFM310]|uniref:Uncharacterized protein n=1 Tax=Trametes coccinea (strain BRFM310) TaxID=1353009 RepID=A0A1Y2IKQ5_TRAC3|nr:hypothetical protein PYCCODRAFT_466716 [Trametes coccinea BRFM310]